MHSLEVLIMLIGNKTRVNMRTFRSDSENDGLITIFPTVLIRQQDDWFSIGFWWGMWAIDFGWWERKTIQILKIIITPFLGILALISLVSFITPSARIPCGLTPGMNCLF